MKRRVGVPKQERRKIDTDFESDLLSEIMLYTLAVGVWLNTIIQ